ARLQQVVQATGHRGEHHVVDGPAERVLDVLEGLHRRLDHREPPVGPDPAVEGTLRREHAATQDLPKATEHLCDLRDDTGWRLERAVRELHEAPERMCDPLTDGVT